MRDKPLPIVPKKCRIPDALFLGMECDGAPFSWLYGPLTTRPLARRHDQARRFDASNFERARALVETFTPRALYVYAMGIEPWLGALMSVDSSAAAPPMIESDRLIAFARERGIPAFRLAGQRRLSFRER